MDDDQQFCLRWNNHQSTLISVFDTLLENETLVDCTLAAEGKFLKAHKVVLSACSPYFATLLQEQYDKHPIFILKDVKYQELRAMMDYMYRGEVNISQDQLAALLKAAESLQIKGLSDNRSGGGTTAPKPEHHRATMPTGKLSAGYTLEQTKRARIAGPAEPEMGSREGSSSPSRRRRKVRRRSIENAMTDVHDNSNSSQQQTQSNASGLGAITAAASALAAAAAAAPNTQSLATNVPLSASTSSSTAVTATGTTLSSSKKTDIVKGTTQQQTQQQQDAMNTENVQGPASAATATGSLDTETTDNANIAAAASTATDKSNHKQLQQQLKQAKESISGGAAAGVSGAGSASELVIEPKAEYDDEANDEPVEDLTLDEEDMGMDDLDQNAGTSQGGEGSSQGYAPWQHDRSQDELLLATQEAQQRDPQDISYKFSQSMIEGGNYLKLNEQYKFNNSIMEGGGGGVAAHGSTERFPCAVCGKSYLRKRHLQRHMRDECIGIPPRFSCDLCPSRFRRKYHMVRHLTSKHGIPPAIAQQTTGNSNRNNSTALKEEGEGAVGGLLAENLTLNHVNLGNCDNGLPENLTMRKENYEHEPTQMHHQHQHHHIHHQLNMGSASPSHMTSGDSGSDCNGGGTAGTSPIPPTHIMPMPTYGLTGAITAISAAAAHVEEKDAKILLEAAAAAAQAAAHNNNIQQTLGGSSTTITPPPTHEDTENVAENQTSLTTTTGNTGVALNSNANTTNEASYIKAEPLTPNKTMAPGQGALNMLDDEWKMKLSLQLISNSLLKERLMNTMPFAYKNN
ncbi:longitudinals lacking protein, isoforms H/M/V isoform X4 [Lucilia sericata]|uniref:longitudinals lacking protein, isoforms H/M/V isoform X4 n=1 Tax=Lucilia sericata TaxID=13632 RepID=UPI0018A87118|nr:longitudinals lacking protein, isoforms H/M/V isoform X4 [Lucilia sericata]